LEQEHRKLKGREEGVRSNLDHWMSFLGKEDMGNEDKRKAEQHQSAVTNLLANSLFYDVEDYNNEVKNINDPSIKPYEYTLLSKEEIDSAKEWGKRHSDQVRQFK
jgi:hypothetical protein